MNKQEYGSDFHYIDSEKWRDVNFINPFFQESNLELYYSGRAALYDIVKSGIKNHAWHTIAVPSYYCHEVVQFIQPLPITIEYYDVTPFKERTFNVSGWLDSKETVVLIVDYFGMSKIDFSHLKESIIIEDFTHNIEDVYSSKAHYCFGSLRKVLPLPVGGFGYSRNNPLVVKTSLNLQADYTAMKRLSAMVMKNLYLEGEITNKEIFRNLYSGTEEKFSNGYTFSKLPKFVNDYLNSLLILKLIKAKKNNLSLAKSLLKTNKSFELITTETNSDFALTLKFKSSEARNLFKNYLIEHNIFPIVLWPNQFLDANKHFEETILFIHVDFRYDQEEITTIITTINKYFDNA